MSRQWRGRVRLVHLVTAGALALLSGVYTAPPTQGSATPNYLCGSGNGIGNRQVVLLVHGYNSGPDTWKPASQQYLAPDPKHTCVSVFDYAATSTRWATDPSIGPALAARIKVLADDSRMSGGTGKVIVVAHSMGGLAVRCAVSLKCSGGRSVAGDIAALVTFGTPNLGTTRKGYGSSLFDDVAGPVVSAACTTLDVALRALPCSIIQALGTSAAAKAFTPGSAQLRALAPLSSTSSFPVEAVAGSVKLQTSFWGGKAVGLGDVGDLIVSEDSADDEGSMVNDIGGRDTVDCGHLDVSSQLTHVFDNMTCWHSSETNNPAFLKRALAVITATEAATTLTLSAGWDGVAPGEDITTAAKRIGLTTFVADCPPVREMATEATQPFVVAPDGRTVDIINVFGQQAIVGPDGLRVGDPVRDHPTLTSGKNVVSERLGSTAIDSDSNWVSHADHGWYFYMRADPAAQRVTEFGLGRTYAIAEDEATTQGGCY